MAQPHPQEAREAQRESTWPDREIQVALGLAEDAGGSVQIPASTGLLLSGG